MEIFEPNMRRSKPHHFTYCIFVVHKTCRCSVQASLHSNVENIWSSQCYLQLLPKLWHFCMEWPVNQNPFSGATGQSKNFICTLHLCLLSLPNVVANFATSACLVFLLHPDNRKCGGKGETDYIRELSEFGLWRKFFVPIHNVGL